MPIIEYKNLERIHSEDRLLDNAGFLLKAGRKIENKVSDLAKHKAGVFKVINFSKEEHDRLLVDDNAEEIIIRYTEQRNSGRINTLRERLKEILLEFHSPFNEDMPVFTIPGKKKHIETGVLLENKMESLYEREIEAGASRIINKYKYKFAIEILKEIYEIVDHFKARKIGEKVSKGSIPRINFSSIRLSSKYDGSRFSMLGDAFVNQAVDIALMFLFVMVNINKQRITEGAPLSEDRFDPDKKTTTDTKYQYRAGLIIEAAAGILLHNIGFSHSQIHETASAKPVLVSGSGDTKEKIKLMQRHINVARHLLENLEISSISKMMVSMQKDYPDGTGFPYLNGNKHKHEFLRLFQIIACYDNMTNPVYGPTAYSRHDIIRFIQANSGTYNHNPHKFNAVKKFDAELVNEFFNVLAPYELHEKTYLYDSSNRSQHIFVAKVISYGTSFCPILTLLKDEKHGKEYRDGQVLLSICNSELMSKKQGKPIRQKLPWIAKLEIIDKGIDPGDINSYKDMLYGNERAVAKQYR